MVPRRLHAILDGTPALPGDRAIQFVLLAILFATIAVLLPPTGWNPMLLGVSAGFVALPLVAWLLALVDRQVSTDLQATLDGTPEAAFLTDSSGRILAGNARADRLRAHPNSQDLGLALSRFCVDPEMTVCRLIDRTDNDGEATAFLGTSVGGTRVRVTSAARGRLLWVISERAVDPDLALLTVLPGGTVLNSAAERLLGGGKRPLDRIVTDLPVRQGSIHRLRSADGSEVEARLIEMQVQGDCSEIAVLPCSISVDPQAMGALAVPPVPDLLSVLPVPMLKVDASGALIEANSEARSILDIDCDPLPPLFELLEGMGRPIADWLSDAAQGRGLLKPEIVRAVVPGQELYLQITLGRMVEQGKVVLVGILNDATELKTLEAQFVQSQKMQAIGQLAGGVAHDFNNLLTAISGHCDLLLLRHEASDPDYADLIQIAQNSNRAASLVGQLLAFSRKQNLKPQSLDLRDTMADLVHLLNRLIGEKVQLDVTHAPGPQMIRADRRQLEQVIVNLVVNARDAMADGGRIEVRTHTEHLAEEMERDRARVPPGDYVVIEVCDNGAGIAPEALPKIFEPFFTTKKTGEGTGLGLSTAYGIVKQTGGFIFVDSTLAEGTVFTLYFPASQDREKPVSEPRKPAASSSAARGDAAILLVEDEAPVRAFACRALRLRGYTVIEASDAEMALSILEDTALRIDLFVTDVIMPGMDGPTWVRKALKDRPETSVVFMSGYAEEGRAEKQARIPNSVFLPKPFSLQQLTALVEEQLH